MRTRLVIELRALMVQVNRPSLALSSTALCTSPCFYDGKNERGGWSRAADGLPGALVSTITPAEKYFPA